MILVRITAPTFVAGAVLDGDRIVEIAPYLAACMRRANKRGRTGLRDLVREHRNDGWKAEVVA